MRVSTERRRLLYVVNVPWFFVMHRLSLALRAREMGYEVHVACGEGAGAEEIVSAGLPFHRFGMRREGRHPLREAKAVFELARLYRRLAPHLVHHVTFKPILYGSLAARVARVPAVINSFAGLGYAFASTGAWARVRQYALLRAFRASFPAHGLAVTFENEDDRELMRSAGVVTMQNSEVLPGVGVDVDEYAASPEPQGKVRILFASRMLKEKGVEDFVTVAQMIREQGVQAEFLLVGKPDPSNPGSIDEQTLSEWHSRGHVSWLGFQSDMPQLISQCHIVCLPTFYREGIPRILLEACASQRPIVATSVPGCREICVPGVSGILVQPHDIAGLYAAVSQLIDDPILRRQLGAGGRKLAEERFSLEIVLNRTMRTYRQLITA